MAPSPVVSLQNSMSAGVHDREPLLMQHRSQDHKVHSHSVSLGNSPSFLEEAAESAMLHLNMALGTLGIIQGNEVSLQVLASQSTLTDNHPFLPLQSLPLPDLLCAKVWQTRKSFVVSDTLQDLETRANWLVQRYGIRAYLGVPLLTSANQCLGILEVMDYQVREFSTLEVAFIEMIGRWCASELEHYMYSSRHETWSAPNWTSTHGSQSTSNQQPRRSAAHEVDTPVNLAKFELITQLTQALKSPLTPVVGMTSVLRQQVHGELTLKQREYLDVVYQSSQELLALINEIVEIGQIETELIKPQVISLDIEMMCRQVMAMLETTAGQRELRMRLTLEDSARFWMFDRELIRLCIYHLIVGVTHTASPGSTLSLHLAQREGELRLVIWASHPWLGDGLRQTDLISYQSLLSESDTVVFSDFNAMSPLASNEGSSTRNTVKTPQEILRILLSQRLAEGLGGKLTLQGAAESGYRLVLTVPPSVAELHTQTSEQKVPTMVRV